MCDRQWICANQVRSTEYYELQEKADEYGSRCRAAISDSDKTVPCHSVRSCLANVEVRTLLFLPWPFSEFTGITKM